MDHSIYDKRKYPIVDAQHGYMEWSRTYEQVVEDAMDLRLFERLQSVDWSAARQVLDLACGTGRIGAWLKGRTSAPIDGVDFTPAMLEIAKGKGVYRALHIADVTQTGIPGGNYDRITQSLADEHLPDLQPLYREVARLLVHGGLFVIVGFHPQFLMAGVPTHYNREGGEPTTIRSYVHLLSDHVKAARAAGLALLEMDEGLVDAEWLRVKPKWEKYLGQPISFSMVWRKN
jgi:SAM-dependent methyltransferase